MRALPSADGRYVLVFRAEMRPGGAVGTAAVYDMQNKRSWDLTSHGSEITAVAWASSAEQVVTGSRDGIVRVGRMTGEEPHLLMGHEGTVLGLQVDPGGRWIASGGDDGTVRHVADAGRAAVSHAAARRAARPSARGHQLSRGRGCRNTGRVSIGFRAVQGLEKGAATLVVAARSAMKIRLFKVAVVHVACLVGLGDSVGGAGPAGLDLRHRARHHRRRPAGRGRAVDVRDRRAARGNQREPRGLSLSRSRSRSLHLEGHAARGSRRSCAATSWWASEPASRSESRWSSKPCPNRSLSRQRRRCWTSGGRATSRTSTRRC